VKSALKMRSLLLVEPFVRDHPIAITWRLATPMPAVGCVADIVASRAAVPRNVCVMDDVRHRAPNAQGSW
jgi:hypothetical protein